MNAGIVATVALALIAAAEYWRDWRAGQRARATVVARLSSQSFMLRRQLRSWLGTDPVLKKGLRGWLQLTRHHETFGGHIHGAEARMIEVAALASELGGDVERDVSSAYQAFLCATNILTHFDAISPSDDRRPHWEAAFRDAEGHLARCIGILEDKAISRRMLAAAQDAAAMTLPSGE